MSEYIVAMTIKSEAILGSGISNVYIHEDCLYDENGFVYFHSKSLKGLFHKTAQNLKIKNRELFFEKDKKSGILTFTNLELPDSIKNILNSDNLSKEEILGLQTNIRQFISIDENGVTKESSLRNIRTINDGIILLGKINTSKELDADEVKDLLFIIKATRNVGMMRNRGRGKVEFQLFNENGDDLAEKYKKGAEKYEVV